MDNVIFSYTRQDAINDGIFIDVSEMAKEAGFKIPVAITSNLYHTHIVPSEDAKTYGQDEKGRLWDVLHMLSVMARHSKDSMITFSVRFQNGPHSSETPKLWAVVEAQSPDDPSPAINIMLPEDY